MRLFYKELRNALEWLPDFEKNVLAIEAQYQEYITWIKETA